MWYYVLPGIIINVVIKYWMLQIKTKIITQKHQGCVWKVKETGSKRTDKVEVV